MAHTFFPYPAKPSVNLSLTFEGATPETVGRTHDFSHLSSEPTSFKVRAEVSFDESLLPTVLDPSEHNNLPHQVVLRIVSTASRKREAIAMVPANGTFAASFDIDPANFFGEIEVEAFVLRSKDLAVQGSTFASDKGAIVMFSTDPQVILLEEKPPSEKNNGLKTRWADFKDPNSPWINHSEEMFAIDSSREPPELVLNTAVAPQVRVVLDGAGTHGPKARTRDLAFAGIAGTAIACLLSETIFSIAGEDPPTLDNLMPWQRNLTELAAPTLYPGLAPADAIERLLKDLGEPDSAANVVRQKVPFVAQQLSRTASSIANGVIEAVNHGD